MVNQDRSPQVDAIERSTIRMQNVLHEDLKQIIVSTQSLPELPEILKEFQERMVEQFMINLLTQVAMEMKVRQTNIAKAEHISKFLVEQTKKKQTAFTEYSNRAVSRYSKMFEELAQEHEAFLNQLDSHVYSIVKKIYPDQIQEKFSVRPNNMLELLDRHAFEASFARTECLDDAYDEVAEEMNEYVEDRELALQEIASMDSGVQEGSYELPYYFGIFVNEDTSETCVEVIFDADSLNDSQNQDLGSRLQFAVEEIPEYGHRFVLEPDTLELISDLAVNKYDVIPEEMERFTRDYAMAHYMSLHSGQQAQPNNEENN